MKIRQIIKNSLLSMAMLAFAHPAFCDRPDLSGTWHLDVAQSSFGSMPAPEAGTLVISTGAHKMIHMESMLKGPADGGRLERTVESDWKVDNKFHPVTGDGEPGEVLAKWEGPVLVGKRMTDAGLEEIRLVTGAGSYILTQTIQSPQGTRTLIWRRK